MPGRPFALRLLPILALFVAGAVVALVAGGSTAGEATGGALMGLAAILVVALLFYEVGLSEDRARSAERPRDPDDSPGSAGTRLRRPPAD